jgi:hypothetical protein
MTAKISRKRLLTSAQSLLDDVVVVVVAIVLQIVGRSDRSV